MMKKVSQEIHGKIHLHLHETKQEVDGHLSDPLYGIRPIERIKKLGLFNKNLIAVHMTQMTEEEIKWAGDSGIFYLFFYYFFYMFFFYFLLFFYLIFYYFLFN